MNYYKNNTVSKEEVDLSTPVTYHPWNVSYVTFMDSAHKNLQRCCECGLKFDMFTLIRLDTGKFICSFCSKGAA